jgi:hypothetical protein
MGTALQEVSTMRGQWILITALVALAPGLAHAQYNIIWYDDFEESMAGAGIRGDLESQGHTVEYHSDGMYLDISGPAYDGFNVVVVEHSCGSGTITGLESWLTSGRGYVALLASSMYNDVSDSYIMTLFDVTADGTPVGSPWGSMSAWNIANLVWVDPTHPIATTPNAGFLPTELQWEQVQYHVDLPGGEPVITDSATGATFLVTRENILGGASGNVAILGTNFHSTTNTDPEVQMLVENIISWTVEGGDVDEDGFTTGAGDCDDHNNAVYPAAPEGCDGLDNDCDSDIDEGNSRSTFYPDVDRDTYGDDARPTLACVVPPGYVTIAGDCDDTRAGVLPGGFEFCDELDNDCDGVVDDGVVYDYFYRDSDHDGFGVDGTEDYTCEERPGWVLVSGDCNDLCAACNPDGTEICDELDNDCDGAIDEGLSVTVWRDADSDGYGNPPSEHVDCEVAEGYVTNGDDCDDIHAAAHPGADELCDGVDNNCDGVVDEGLLTTFYADTDGDGYGDDATAVEACAAPQGYVATSGDCVDTAAAINPAAAEVEGDEVDNDCDGTVDEGPGADADADVDADADAEPDGGGDADADADVDADADGGGGDTDGGVDRPEEDCSCRAATAAGLGSAAASLLRLLGL